MCPACMASAAVVAGSVMSTGGLTALAVKVFRSKKSRPADVSKNATERKKDHGDDDEQNGNGKSGSAS